MIHDPVMSYSRAQKFESCPRSYYYRYILGLDDPAGEPAMIGSFVHEVLEILVDSGHRDIESAKKIAKTLWDNHEIFSQATPNLSGKFKKSIWGKLESFFKIENKKYFESTSFECELNIEASYEGCNFRGIIDRVDEHNKIADYKTGKAKSEHGKQLDFYVSLINGFTFTPVDAEIIYLNDAPKIVERVCEPDRQKKIVDEIINVRNQILELDADIIDEWMPKKSWLCNYCNFKSECPLFRGSDSDWDLGKKKIQEIRASLNAGSSDEIF